jgi:hypothetical protein
MKGRTVYVPSVVILVSWALICTGCKKEEQTPEGAFETARQLLADDDSFGTGFDQAIMLLESMQQQEGPSDKMSEQVGLMLQSQAILELFLAAWLSGDQDLYEKLKSVLQTQLDGPLSTPRNFQLVAQLLLERFRKVARRDADAEVKARAQALVLYTMGLQAVLFRAKQAYFKGRLAVIAHDELRYLDATLAIRDLVVETLHRTERPEENWQYITLTVVGRVCERTAARYVALLCTPDDPSTTEEFCHSDLKDISASRKARGKGFLSRFCLSEEHSETDGSEPAGLDLVMGYYDRAFDELEQKQFGLSSGLRHVLSGLKDERSAASAALETLFNN